MRHGDPPAVSVLIPARDAARHLPATLDALLAGDYPPDHLEVVVAVAPSRDATRAVAERPRIRVVANPTGGTSAGLNAALAASTGEVIVRLDAHALPARDYVSACVAALARTGAWAVGGPMAGAGGTPFGAAVAAAQATWLGSGGAAYRLTAPGAPRPVDTVYLGAWPRAVLERLGGFDETLERNQDYELCERIRAAGGEVWLDPAIRTVTRTRDTPLALARQYLGYGGGRAATWRRHRRSLRVRQAVPAAFVAALALATSATVATGKHRRAPAGGPAAGRPLAGRLDGLPAACLVAVTGPYTLAVAAVATRYGGAMAPGRLRLAGALVIMHLAWGIGFWWGLAKPLLARRRRR